MSARTVWVGLAVIGALGWPLVIHATNDYHYGVLAAVYSLVGVSLVVLVGWTGQISLGHAAFFGFGVYMGQKALAHGDPLGAIVLVALFGALASLVLGVPSLRLRGVYLTIATLAFGLACQRYFFVLNSVRGTNAKVVLRPKVLWFSITSDFHLYYLVALVLGISILISYNLRRTDTGRTLFAIRDSEDAAQAMAIRIAPYKIGAFAFSAAIATVAGMFYGMLVQATPGGDQFGVLQGLLLLSIPIIGGIESLFGAIIGGTFLAVAQPLFNLYSLRLYLGSSIGLVLVLLSGYDGVTGMLRAAVGATRSALTAEDSVRYGSFVPAERNGTAADAPRVGIRLHGSIPEGSIVRARVVGNLTAIRRGSGNGSGPKDRHR